MRTLPAVVVGLAAGAMAGILMAPDSGSNTRKKLSDRLLAKLNYLNTTVHIVINQFFFLHKLILINSEMPSHHVLDKH